MKKRSNYGLGSQARRHFLVGSGNTIAFTAVTALGAGLCFRFGGAMAAVKRRASSSSGPMSPEVKLVDDYNAWFIGGGYGGDMEKLKAGLPAYITDQTVLHEPVSLPWGGTMIGYDGWVRLCQISDPIFARISDRMEISSPKYYQSGSVVLHQLKVTFKPKLAGETPFVMEIIEKYTVENGRIKQIDEFWADTATLLEKLALMGAILPVHS